MLNEANLAARLALVERDSALGPELIGSFGSWVRDTTDEELFRVDVVGWARERGIAESTALDLFLHAASAGIFELEWGAFCPICGMLIQTPGGLRALGPNPHCNLCRVTFPCAIDDQIAVAFSVEPAIRALRFHRPDGVDPKRDANKLFFGGTRTPTPGSMSLLDMIQSARGVRVGESSTIEAELPAGNAALLVPDVHAVAFLSIEEGAPSEASFEVHDGALLPAHARLAPGVVHIRVVNRMNHAVSALALRLPPAGTEIQPTRFQVDRFLTGKRVLTSQTFRDLFRTETIGAQGLSVKRLTMLFSDLTGSTVLYERVGDLRALELVRTHFDVVTDVIRRNDGAVVKTIGDAVMGAFSDPEAGVAAAAAMSRAVAEIHADGERLSLKIGLHAGPCVAIQTNHQIDYFGSAVNTAARVQGVARAGEIVVSAEIFDAKRVPERIAELGFQVTPDRVTLRGLAEPVSVFRLR